MTLAVSIGIIFSALAIIISIYTFYLTQLRGPDIRLYFTEQSGMAKKSQWIRRIPILVEIFSIPLKYQIKGTTIGIRMPGFFVNEGSRPGTLIGITKAEPAVLGMNPREGWSAKLFLFKKVKFPYTLDVGEQLMVQLNVDFPSVIEEYDKFFEENKRAEIQFIYPFTKRGGVGSKPTKMIFEKK